MDRTTKSVVAVTLLIMGILMGTNGMVSDEGGGNWLWWALVFLSGAAFFYWWIRRGDRQTQMDAQAQLEEAERQMEELEEATAQAIYESAQSADERVEEALERAGIESEVDAEDVVEDEEVVEAVTDEEPAETVEQDDIFEANKTPIETAPEPDNTPEPSPPSEMPSGEEVLQGVEEGDPLAEQQVSDATAQKPVSDDVVEITPEDAEKVDFTDAEEEAVLDAREAIDDIDADDLADEAEAEIAQDDDDSAADELEAQADAPDDDEPDDLKLIEGIGPAYERYLNAAGIVSFAQVAEMDADALAELVEEQDGRRSASMGTWAEQAALAAEGNWDALETLQDELKGGRRE